jgi:lysozyme
MPSQPVDQSVNAAMKMSPAARTRMRTGEKVIMHYYNDMGKKRGHCTWGAGILAHRGICNEEELARKVSVEDINREFDSRVASAETAVKRNVKVPLNQDQFDALVSLTYNAGVFGASDTYGFVNRGDFNGAADNISSMIKVTIKKKGKAVLVTAPGLVKRRAEESAPFRAKEPVAAERSK